MAHPDKRRLSEISDLIDVGWGHGGELSGPRAVWAWLGLVGGGRAWQPAARCLHRLVDLPARPFKRIFEAALGRRYVRTTTKTNEHTDYLGMPAASTSRQLLPSSCRRSPSV